MDGVTYRPKAEVSVNYTRADAGGPRLGFFSLLFVWNFDWIGLNWRDEIGLDGVGFDWN